MRAHDKDGSTVTKRHWQLCPELCAGPVDFRDCPARRGRAFEAAFFDEDLAIRVVGDTLVLAPALIATEADIEAISQRSALSLTAWFRRFRLLSH